MGITVDARGLLCPEPVLMVKRAIESKTGGAVRVLVDNSAARENVTRLAKNSGWSVSADADGMEFILTLSR
ncbi:MAG: SirA family protein [Peptococcaceae bacterium BICA1-7]|nr:MAG: SirA family protein [Peptococcaceae bacterium BICA1-7]HBV96042.1 SirA family protein [Desulfotomaculum sp.]